MLHVISQTSCSLFGLLDLLYLSEVSMYDLYFLIVYILITFILVKYT